MPSSRALQSAQALFGSAAPPALVRQECGIGDVPQSDEGLRVLAASGNWTAVALLAEQLGTSVASSPDDDGGAAVLRARLQYILVQVTAYFHLRSFAAAKRLVDALGDLWSDRFAAGPSGPSLVPFSLHFAAALLPMHCGAPTDTRRRLGALREHCRRQAAEGPGGAVEGPDRAVEGSGRAVEGPGRAVEGPGGAVEGPGRAVEGPDRAVEGPGRAVEGPGGGAAEAARWTARQRRVERALAVSHFQTRQFAEGLRMLEELIVAERYDSDDVDYTTVRQLLHLQQLATWSLYCGHTFLSEDAFAAIERLNTSDETADVKQFHHFIVALNQGLRLVANDRFDDAAQIFQEVARGTRKHCDFSSQSVESQQEQSPVPKRSLLPTVSGQQYSLCADARAQSALCRMAFKQLWTHAASSHVTCMLYETTDGKKPVSLMPTIIDTMESYIRQGPVELLHVDAFLATAVRIYTLEGNTEKHKIERLKDLLEVFRCDKASSPVVKK